MPDHPPPLFTPAELKVHAEVGRRLGRPVHMTRTGADRLAFTDAHTSVRLVLPADDPLEAAAIADRLAHVLRVSLRRDPADGQAHLLTGGIISGPFTVRGGGGSGGRRPEPSLPDPGRPTKAARRRVLTPARLDLAERVSGIAVNVAFLLVVLLVVVLRLVS